MQPQLEIELLNDEIKENERLEMNAELKDISSKVEEVNQCINYISNFPDYNITDFSEPIKSYRLNPLSGLLDDFIAGNVNEDEINEVITEFDKIKKEFKPK